MPVEFFYPPTLPTWLFSNQMKMLGISLLMIIRLLAQRSSYFYERRSFAFCCEG